MKQPVIASGWGMNSAFAEDFPALITGLKDQKFVSAKPWFATDDEWQNLRLTVNPHTVPDEPAARPGIERIRLVIDQALKMAQLNASDLAGKRVRVYIAGSGVRGSINDFIGYLDRNDTEDLLFFPQIKNLHAKEYGQDQLAHALLETYSLSWPPVSLYCASNSSLAALHLAQSTIAGGGADLALVIGWTEILYQDVVLLGGLDMLGDKHPQPFSHYSDNILPANGTVALIIESEQHATRRGFTPQITIKSSVCYQSGAARGNSTFSADFRSIAQTLDRAIQAADLELKDIACAMPHGNGIIFSDKSEAMALQKVMGKHAVPVVSYKGQFGYSSACSGVLDFMVACDALMQRRLLPMALRYPVDESLELDLPVANQPYPLTARNILKSGLGIDGSVIAMVLSACQEDIHELS
ncbi:beta-ketoacyl synthase N-terminal-like domain-containing protein [uncultured Cedecea sp.]|uniref:beta-ketoacyl synthase N-terminal-like domain-containing protein n=1 Tax=uncultured Cedecea sp. TaxID=988762 RepID=UPI002625A561|nr:beta-ketoacyl synthase N-terminal-like domain-containing protein [uncultured Cedecea sp.]